MKIRHSEPDRYRKDRAAAYPDICDQLDAAVKMGSALRAQGIVLPDDVNAWIDQCQAVKKRYPKQA